MTDLMDGPEDKQCKPSEALKKFIEKTELDKQRENIVQQQMMHAVGGGPFYPFNSCPACGRGFPNTLEPQKEEKDLLTKDEKELLVKLEKLVRTKRQFLMEVQRVQNL